MAPQNPRDMREYLRTLERLTTQQRAMPSMVSNTLKIIKEEVREEKIRHPAAPVELVPETALYFDNGLRRQRARVMVDFPDVVFNTDGTPATIHQYELWGREVTVSTLFTTTSAVPSQAAPGLTLPGLAATAANELIAETETTWLAQATSAESLFQADGYVPGSVWMFRVRALGEEAIQPGEWSEEITVQMLENTVPPPQPTAPVVEASRGQLIVTWDGLSVDGAMPADFSYAILAHGTDSSPTYEIAQFGRGGGIHVLTGVAYYDPQFFRLCAVDNSGNVSAWSEQADGFTTPLVDVDIILSEIDAAKTRITNAGQAMVAEGVTLAKKLTDADEAIAEATEDMEALNNRISPLAAGLELFNNTTLPELQASVNDKTQIIRSTSAAGNAELYTVGDRWERWSTLANGGKLLQTWRHNGTEWLAEIIDPTYLPQVDIGSGTFGSLDGGRLAAKSVSAQAIAVGDFTNYASGSDFEDPALNPWELVSGWTVSSVRAKTGTHSLRVVESTSTSLARLKTQIPVVEGESLYFGYWVWRNAAAENMGSNSKLRLGDQDGKLLYSVPYDLKTLPGTSQWVRAEGTYKVDPGVTSLAISLQCDLSVTGQIHIDDIEIRRMDSGKLIVAGSITGDHIDAESVGAKVGSFFKLDVSDLTVTKNAVMPEATIKRLHGDILSYRKITTNQLSISPYNMMSDPMHQDSVIVAGRIAESDGVWTSGKDGDTLYSGNYLESHTKTGNLLLRFCPLNTGMDLRIPVTPGQEVVLEVQYRYRGVNVDTTAVNSFGGQVFWDDANKSYLHQVNAPVDTSRQILGPVWAKLTQSFVVPEGARFGRFGIRVTNLRFSSVQVGSVVLREKATGDLIVDGSILTKHLTVTEDMTVALLKAHKVLASEINVNTLAADTAFVGAMEAKIVTSDVFSGKSFTGGTFTGAVFRTTTKANTGVTFSTAGIQAWDTASKQTFNLNAATGALTVSGKLQSSEVLGVKVEIDTLRIDNDTRLRPMIQFTFPASSAFEGPRIYAEFDQPGLAHMFGHGSLVMRSARLTSTGNWSVLGLNGDGRQVSLQTRTSTGKGREDQCGLQSTRGQTFIRGALSNNSGYTNAQFRTGEAPGTGIGAASFVDYHIPFVVAPADYRVRPFVTVDSDYLYLTVTCVALTESSFRCRVYNPIAGAVSVHSVQWFAVSSARWDFFG